LPAELLLLKVGRAYSDDHDNSVMLGVILGGIAEMTGRHLRSRRAIDGRSRYPTGSRRWLN
jgi:hypothetical protein